MRRAVLPVLLIVVGLAVTACVPYRLGAADLLATNAQVAARGEVIDPVVSIRQAAPADVYRVTEERVAAPWGDLALTQVESDPRRPLIVFCGGSAFRQDVRGAVTAKALSKHGDVWLFDYPGFGRSGGRGAPEDFDALAPAMAARIEQAYVGGRTGPLVLVGHSFGGGVCARLAAATRSPSSLVLVGAFQTYESVVQARAARAAGPLGRLIKPVIASDVPRTDIVEALADYQGPIIIVGSRDDRIVPYRASAKLAWRLRAANKHVELVPFETGEHVAFQTWPGFETRLAQALSRTGAAGARGR